MLDEPGIAAGRMRELLEDGSDRSAVLARFVGALPDDDARVLAELVREVRDDDAEGQ